MPANPLMTEIHNKDPNNPRMPAILTDEGVRVWLDPAEQNSDRLLLLLQPYPEKLMQAHAVRPFKSGDDSPFSRRIRRGMCWALAICSE